ncbi:MAG: hypothetical protein ACQET0_11320, partial [Pseudomonadota bacterium]
MFFTQDQDGNRASRRIVPLQAGVLEGWLQSASPQAQRWVRASTFEAEPGSSLVVPDGDGNPDTVLVGYDPETPAWALAGLPDSLPEGDYSLAGEYEEQALAL